MVLGKYHVSFNRLTYIMLYLAVMHFVAFMNIFMAGNQVNTIIVDVIAIYSIVITVTYVRIRLINLSCKFSLLDIGVLLFLFFSVISCLFYLQPSNPASIKAYAYGIHLLILPSLLYFTSKGLDTDSQRKLIKFIFSLHMIFICVGFVMFIWRPDFYTLYLQENLASRGATEIWQVYTRLQSYFGSTATGILAAVTIVMLSFIRIHPFLKYLLLMLLLIAVILTQQRGAYLSAIIATLFLIIHNKYDIKYLLIVGVVFFLGATYVVKSSGGNIEYLVRYTTNRISEDLLRGDPYSERADSYRKGMIFLSEFPLGMGIGATTSAADTAGAHPGGQVVDANYMRILSDLGVAGLYLFVIVLALGARSIIVRHKPRAYLIILFIYCFQATGTNVFDSFYVSHIFWLFLGIIDSSIGNKV